MYFVHCFGIDVLGLLIVISRASEGPILVLPPGLIKVRQEIHNLLSAARTGQTRVSCCWKAAMGLW